MTRPRKRFSLFLSLCRNRGVCVWVGHSGWGWHCAVSVVVVEDAAHDIQDRKPAALRCASGDIVSLIPEPQSCCSRWPRWSHWRAQDTDSVVAVGCLPLNAIMTSRPSVAHRPRPATALVSAHSTSFPSVHVGRRPQAYSRC